jgi:RHH-type transcriptional regulator, proline utilization regulon repressor / proline dehydrogenase / delta 1-pyrroline-5-carboxylate dehydrogenase
MITAAHDVECLTRTYGREIFSRLDRQGPVLFSPAWWDEHLMGLTMRDPAVKVQLFRFIDVLPLLHSAPEINRHLREYFQEASAHLPAWARAGLRWMPRDGLAGRLLARTARSNAQRLARRFIAGSNLNEALRAIARLRQRSLAFTVDLLGEAIITEVEAQRYQMAYLELIDGLSREVNGWRPIPLIDQGLNGPLPRVNASIKLSGLYSQFDPIDPEGTSRAVSARLRPILRAARQQHAFVNVDMEQYAYKDLTLRIFRDVLMEEEFRTWGDVGIAIQAYLHDSGRDLEELARWAEARGTPVWVRLIKGAYWDYETVVAAQQDWPVPVFTAKWETDAQYERLTQFLLERHQTLRPAFGSHNIRSLAHVLATAKALGVPPAAYEIQMLYGMAGEVMDVLVSLGQRVRVYTPYGQLLPGMAYLVRRLLENTANESFLRASFTEHVPEDQLLMNPLQKASGNGGIDSDGRFRLPSGTWPTGASGPARQAGPTSHFRNQPLADFSQAAARQSMQAALARVKSELGRTYPPIVANGPVPTAATIDSLNPSHSREVVGRCARATVADAERAIAAAKAAFPAWRATDPKERAALLFRAAQIMRRRSVELAAWEVYECGKQWRESDADVAEAIDYCEYYGQEMLRLASAQHFDVPGEENAYFYEPRGVTVVIAPWNFPLAILCGMSTAALVTGNPVIMKPAEQSAVMGAKLMEVLLEAGVPAGVANYLPGVGEEIGPTLVNHPDVAMIAFTGSRGVGLHINREAGNVVSGQEQVKRVLAEMGGKNAVIVDEDADLDEAVHGVVASAFGYQGQKCSACSRAIVLEKLHDAFLERLIEATRSLKMAPAEDPGCAVGPLIDAEARRRVLDYVAKGKEEARLVFAAYPGPLAEEGFYVGPHVFSDVPPNAVIAQEEIFGPVLAVLRARDLTEALAIANGTPYALTGGMFSRSPENIRRVRREFRVGNLYINRKITGALVAR